MNARDVYRLIHSLDVREALRKFQPRHAIVAVNENGEVVAVERFKHHPKWSEQDTFFASYKGCVFFFATPETYPTLEELERKIESCIKSLKNREANKQYRGKGLVGDTYFGGRRPRERD